MQKFGLVEQVRPMKFSNTSDEVPQGLECVDIIVHLKPGTKNYFKIFIINESNHDIFLTKNTIIDSFIIYHISSIIPLKVKTKEIDDLINDKNVPSINRVST